ncbi:hypothetical protein ACVPOY_06355 [Staphylococcus aureus]
MVIPYLIYAVIVLLLNIFYSDLKITMTLFGLFFAYNVVILFIAFIKHYKRTLLLSLILTVLSGAAFFGIIYVYGINVPRHQKRLSTIISFAFYLTKFNFCLEK